MQSRIKRIAEMVAVNAVPVVGVFRAGWTDATALSLYWCENVMLVILISLRIFLHRRLTRKRGHYEAGKAVVLSGKNRNDPGKPMMFGKGFLVTGIFFSFWSAVFFGLIRGGAMELESRDISTWAIDMEQLSRGLIYMSAFMVAGFLSDLPGLRRKPFAWVESLALGATWRLFFVLMVMCLGLGLAWLLHLPRAIFILFALLKLYTDIAEQPDPVERSLRWARAEGASEEELEAKRKKILRDLARAEETQ